MKLKFLLPYMIAVLLMSCKEKAAGQRSTKFGEGQRLAEHNNKTLKESSGLVASVANPGMLWTHNDKGNPAEVYLIDKELNIKLTVSLSGISNRDWEDVAIGPGPEANVTYLYVGDIGDNDAQYPDKIVYRFAEPKLGNESRVEVSAVDKITFRLEDGMKDSEALLLDSKTKDLYLVSKRESQVSVYTLPFPQSVKETSTAKKVHTLPFGEIVAADYQNGTGDILMKNYETIYHWENTQGLDFISLLKTEPKEVSYEKEPQGEGIAWAADGSGFFTLSEQKKKKPTWLYFYPKK